MGKLRLTAIQGLIWTGIETVGARLISLVIQVILARLLSPKDFGIIGMITVFISVSQSLVNSGFQNALIREKHVGDKEKSTVFFFNLGMSLFLYTVLFISAPFISQFYHTPILTKILRVLGLVLIINAFGLIQQTILTKEMNFKVQTQVNIFAAGFSGIIAIGCAWMGMGVWSLVFQNLLNRLIQAVCFMILNRWKPILKFDLHTFKKFFDFGWKLTASGILNTVYQNIYYLIIGKFYSATDLGYYTNSQKFNDVPVQSLTLAIQKVSYPLLSKMNGNDLQLKAAYRSIIRYAAAASFMMMMMLSSTAKDLIPFVFGSKWTNSVPYFQILCYAGMFLPINALNLNILQVKGRSDLFLSLEVVKKIVGGLAIFGAISLHTGVLGLVWANVLATLFNTSLNILISARLIQYSYFEQVKDFGGYLISALVMSVGILFLGQLSISAVLLKLFIQYLCGAIIYIVIGKFLFKLPELDELFLFVNRFFLKVTHSKGK